MFKTAQNLTGWCGLSPKNDESAGKIKSLKLFLLKSNYQVKKPITLKKLQANEKVG